MALTLAYTLEMNQIWQGQAQLIGQHKFSKELALTHQEALEKLSIHHIDGDLTQEQASLALEQITVFTLLEPKTNQLSLNQQFSAL